MGDDMAEMFQKVSEMLKNNEIPDNVKSMMNSFVSEQNNSSTSQEHSSNTTENEGQRDSNDSFEMPNIDLNTRLTLRKVTRKEILMILLKCLILIWIRC